MYNLYDCYFFYAHRKVLGGSKNKVFSLFKTNTIKDLSKPKRVKMSVMAERNQQN